MIYLGDFQLGQAIHFLWSTYDALGASVTRGGDGEVRLYKNAEVAQSTADIIDTEDFDGLVGIHHCEINLNPGAFFGREGNYTVVLSGATIDGKSVNAVLAHFRVENHFPSGVVRGTFVGTPTTTSLEANMPNNISDTYIGRGLIIVTGNAAGEGTLITDYVGGTPDVLTVETLITAPASGDDFIIV